ncbi:MAG: invasion associated locus B family protein [Rhodobacteraceae bacterium]|nr:invasion associated locus B family protein [Paracoccaceae bacterium]
MNKITKLVIGMYAKNTLKTGLGFLVCLWLPTTVFAQAAIPSALSETYASWRVSCATPEKTADQAKPQRQCEILQEVTQGGSGQRLFAISLRQNDQAAEATIIAPFGLALPDGVSLMIGERPLVTATFSTCVAVGCVAKASLTMDQVSRLERANTFSATMTGNQGKPISLALAPSGFSAAWARLQAVDAESKAP